MAGATGLEPATYGVTGRHSNQLSYAPAGAFHAISGARKRADVRPTLRPVKEGKAGNRIKCVAFRPRILSKKANVFD